MRGDVHYQAAGRVTWCRRFWWSKGPKGRRLLLSAVALNDVTCPECVEAVELEQVWRGLHRWDF